LGVLLASGLIVGEGLFGVLISGVIIKTGSATPFAVVGDSFAPAAFVLGTLGFAALAVAMYRWIATKSQEA
jgi:hypothetical protein